MAEVEHRLVGAPDFGFVGLVVVALEGGRKRGDEDDDDDDDVGASRWRETWKLPP